ncbi:MAG: DUF1080 domain-containing protein, partial [Verrucomicrobiae bacterium]|nr:DUF1080 domain-containing protein [Verrucomicrobiae bacterium]
VAAALGGVLMAQETAIEIDADAVLGRVGPGLTGACIEDVNHEIYGGLYSQMIFGESFQEPPWRAPFRGFTAYGGEWRLTDGTVWGEGPDGPKLVSEVPAFSDGEVGVEVFLKDAGGGNAGLIVRVDRPGPGADNFAGYEVSLDAAAQVLRLGRHRHNWELIRDIPCEVPIGRWIALVVKLAGNTLEVHVDGRRVIRHEDRDHPLESGTIGLRPWAREAGFRNLWLQRDGITTPLPFQRSAESGLEVSRMWRPVQRGSALLAARLETAGPFVGVQSQRIEFLGGGGEVGIGNRGLNRQGMAFVAGRPYEGHVWVRAVRPVDLFVALESDDGTEIHAEKRLPVAATDWQRLDFELTPHLDETQGRFALKLKAAGAVDIGYAFLQPGAWGRFQGLPDRRDVVEALQDQGITVLRYGGSMINAPEYRWKQMIGPRDRRPPYRGTWYPHSSNGWGIFDFLNLCEAAGFLGIPAVNMNESPADMADFMEYVNGSADSEWGRRRAADGHPAPYRLKCLELGNEERVDGAYFEKFKALAETIWARDPDLTLVVGDFVYSRPIHDPMHFDGAASRITSLAAHQKILALAREHDREVWFDVHVWTEGPGASDDLRALPSYVAALEKLAGGARHKVVVFEFNANNHAQRRALGNALAIQVVEQLGEGRIPIATSANCLQVDGQNDNGWNQGLLFLNPSQVWLQPPGYLTRMLSRNHAPLLVKTTVRSPGDVLQVTAKRAEDGSALVVLAV